ncbi:hypothetical protein NECHADRAFT_70711 [Paecilomyces variotii No. 5]|uniref:Alcohol acetyltransferase n=1 Tax=Byssochlamys spectabilis (strain No. 5 / NBRC 109023) TaxID=1356009 RepID=V5FWF1_BYSSN|nr:hypothetical protein NECHADRAFT_70711 [Paecilomyces variotii No. 5]
MSPPPPIQQSPLQWTKSQRGRIWERDLDECEMFYRAVIRNGSGCHPVTACASFAITSRSDSGSGGVITHEKEVQNALQRAWIMLRYEHPTLRSRVEHYKERKENERLKRVYEPFASSEGETSWVGTTFKVIDVDCDDVDGLNWFNEHASSAFEMPTVFLLRSKKKETEVGRTTAGTVFLRCPHDITDGVGVLQLLDQLFEHAARAFEEGGKYSLPEWGNEHERLSPCLRVAAGIPDRLSEAQFDRFQQVQTRNGSIYNHPALLGLPSSSSASSRTHPRIQRLAICVSRSLTEKVLLSCKAIAPGVSVTHVFMAALASALAELQLRKEEPYPVRYVNHSMINLRPYCREPYNRPDHAAATYHTISAQALMVDVTVPSSGSNSEDVVNLSELAVKVRDFYNSIRPVVSSKEPQEQVLLAPFTFKGFTPLAGSDPHAASDPPFCPVALSSIGNIASRVKGKHGPFELTNVWAASEPLGAGVALFLGSWDCQIQLSGVFDTRYHNAEYVEKFLNRILHRVYKGLGIREDC